jgi:membrane-bound lytic murein transglycosylase D
MAIQAAFLVPLVGFFAVLASGLTMPAAADSLFDGPINPEVAAVSESFVEPPVDEGGSTALGASREEQLAPLDVDPWAEAFAASARLAVVPKPPEPAYPVTLNQPVQYFLERFTGSRRAIIELWLSRSTRYLGMIREVLRSHRLPEDLAFTAMIESGFNPLAVSRAGAKGMWQFMDATARRYGLRVDQWVDERLDPYKSTIAAAGYLRDLYGQFGSWTLAQAAYNAGEVRIAKAMKASGTSDFWSLARTGLLKQETNEFVPQIHAATLIGRDPATYGFQVAEDSLGAVETVTVPPSTKLSRIAAATGVSTEMLQSLNPVLVRGMTPPGSPYELKVPVGMRAGVLTALARRPHQGAGHKVATAGGKTVRAARSKDVHVVRPRDTVTSIARQYGVTVGDVLRWNSLDKPGHIRPGDRLRVVGIRPSVERDGQGGFR